MYVRSSKLLSVLVLLVLASVAAVGQDPVDKTVIAPDCAGSAYLLELFSIGGRPLNHNDGEVKILVNNAYAVGYSEERRNPLWAVYQVDGLKPGGQPATFVRSNFFLPDTRVTPSVDGRTFGGGMDRGHMVPNFAISTQYGSLAQLETFLMTNMCPQSASLNQGPWARLEAWIPEAAAKLEQVFVTCGPIFGSSPSVVTHGPERKIQVPEAFYMILVEASNEHKEVPTLRALAFKFPQGTKKTDDFQNRSKFGANIDQIEKETGLELFPNFDKKIPAWATIEKKTASEMWDID